MIPAEFSVRYADSQSSLRVRHIFQWDRGDFPRGATMSASSGPKDYVKNQVYALLAAAPTADLVVMVRASGPTFFLVKDVDGNWFDVTGKQVEVSL